MSRPARPTGRRAVLGTLAALVALAGTALVLPAQASEDPTTTVLRTRYGAVHVRAGSWTGLGLGAGYAMATDTLCTMAEEFVTLDGQRARFFGPDGRYRKLVNGVDVSNLDADFYYARINADRRAEQLFAARTGVNALDPRLRELGHGFVLGYNRYLRQVGGAAGVPDQRCRGMAWVRPIGDAQVARRILQIAQFAASGALIPGLAAAQPPTALVGAGAARSPDVPPGTAAALAGAGGRLQLARDIGSNGLAVGSALTGGAGVLLQNPHLPWQGSERLYQLHLTLTGATGSGGYDVTGGAILGTPLPAIAANRDVAYTATNDTAYRFTPYQLTLAPGDPTSYLVDGVPEKMRAQRLTVQARQADGSLRPVSRTLYSSRWGPMLTNLAGIPLPWTTSTAFALADVNADNFRYATQFFRYGFARSTDEVMGLAARYAGAPFQHTIAADRRGVAGYSDDGSIPNVPNALATDCASPVGRLSFSQLGLPTLDGSRSACAWATDPDSPEPGRFGARALPTLVRRDYVLNSNDSHWLTNAAQPLEGFARILGPERTARSLRTRNALDSARALRRVDAAGVEAYLLRERVYAADLVRAETLALCRSLAATGAPSSQGIEPVPAGTCDTLERWDRTDRPGSSGALLFRRFWARVYGLADDPEPIRRWRTPFDPARPIDTPRDLDTDDPIVRRAFGDALRDLRTVRLTPQSPLSAFQRIPGPRGRLVAVGGGPGNPQGVLNVLFNPDDYYFNRTELRAYGDVISGSSYVGVVTFDGGPCPRVRALLTYGQSDDPANPHYRDQTPLLGAGRLVDQPVCPAAVDAAAVSRIQLGAAAPRLRPAGGTLPATGPAAPTAGVGLLLLVAVAALRRRL